MSEKVVALPGYAVPTPRGEPVQGIVDTLEEALDQARQGVLVGVILAKVMDGDGVTPPFYEKTLAHRAGAARDLLAALEFTKHRFLTYMFDED